MSNTTQTLDSAPIPPSWAERQAALRAKAGDPDRCAAGGIIRRLLDANGKGPVELGAEIARIHGEVFAEYQALLWYIEDLEAEIAELKASKYAGAAIDGADGAELHPESVGRFADLYRYSPKS